MNIPYVTLRRILLAVTALTLFLHYWVSRHVMHWDGISYVEIAQRLTVNAYWSPLFSWTLAPLVRILPPEDHAAALHALQAVLSFASVALALRLFERLYPDMEHRRGWLVTAWACSTWAAASLAGVFIVHPDVLVLCLFLIALHLLLSERWLPLGLTLGLLYLAKAAMFGFAAALLLCLWLFQSRQAALRTAAVFALVCTPWIALLYRHTSHLTIGESGTLNYAWEVGDVRRGTHWQDGEHPTRQVWQQPEAFVYATPIEASYPPWYEPSYWYAGVRPVFDLARQLRALAANITVAAWFWLSAPGLIAPLVLLGRTKSWSGYWHELWRHRILLAASLAVVAMYCVVFVEQRYIAGPLLILSAIPLAGAYRRAGVAGSRIYPFAAAAMLLWSLGPMTFAGAYSLATGASGPNPHGLLARELSALGLTPGTKLAVVGLPFSSDWARIGGYRIIGEVGPRAAWSQTLPRLFNLDHTNLEQFWNLTPAARELVLEKFREAGAAYVVASMVSTGADMRGWTRLQHEIDDEQSGPMWIRRLGPAPRHLDGPVTNSRQSHPWLSGSR